MTKKPRGGERGPTGGQRQLKVRLKSAKQRKPSSKAWLERQLNDPYVAAARRETPEATLSELAERSGLHRSAVQRSLERIETLALHDDDGAGLTRRPAGRSTHPRAGRRAALA